MPIKVGNDTLECTNLEMNVNYDYSHLEMVKMKTNKNSVEQCFQIISHV